MSAAKDLVIVISVFMALVILYKIVKMLKFKGSFSLFEEKHWLHSVFYLFMFTLSLIAVMLIFLT